MKAAGDAQIVPARRVAATAPFVWSSMVLNRDFWALSCVVVVGSMEGANARVDVQDATSRTVMLVNFIFRYY